MYPMNNDVDRMMNAQSFCRPRKGCSTINHPLVVAVTGGNGGGGCYMSNLNLLFVSSEDGFLSFHRFVMMSLKRNSLFAMNSFLGGFDGGGGVGGGFRK